jgi:hypothetical protein
VRPSTSSGNALVAELIEAQVGFRGDFLLTFVWLTKVRREIRAKLIYYGLKL